ncbi:hypothetical protein N7470_002703 [Penicillium chermesinum]|nr:hypothetical protein N7470_002703 [Penicillium chermesinum]
MSGLLGKLAGQVSGQQSGQPSEGSSGLVHKVTDAITGQKHPQDGQGYPPTYGSNQEGRPYPSDTKFTFRELWPVHPHRSIRTKSLICQGTEKVIMVSPKTRIPTAIATKMDTVVTAIGMTALEAMADDTTLVIPLTATRVTTEAMALIPMEETLISIRLVTVDTAHQVGIKEMARITKSIMVDTMHHLATKPMGSILVGTVLLVAMRGPTLSTVVRITTVASGVHKGAMEEATADTKEHTMGGGH